MQTDRLNNQFIKIIKSITIEITKYKQLIQIIIKIRNYSRSSVQVRGNYFCFLAFRISDFFLGELRCTPFLAELAELVSLPLGSCPLEVPLE